MNGEMTMPSSFERKARELVHDLTVEITRMERELENKKDILKKLQLIGVEPVRRGRKPGAKYGRRAVTEVAVAKPGRKARRVVPGRRKSKNRDLILKAASSFNGSFKLHNLQAKVLSIDPKFGGSHPSGAIIAVIRTTPEIKKVKRGEYKFAG
jgi:hypothetical protein